MSRQIQIRRGTAAENDNFTGAIGEITMDTTNKTLRVHDGETVGGITLAKKSEISEIANADYVVETQLPTAENNYTWYRKYKSGWVEQGGIITDRQGAVTFSITMADTNYNVCFTGCLITSASPSSAEINPHAKNLTETGMYIYTNRADQLTWKICGMCAN